MESLSSATSGSVSILFVLCSFPLHLAAGPISLPTIALAEPRRDQPDTAGLVSFSRRTEETEETASSSLLSFSSEMQQSSEFYPLLSNVIEISQSWGVLTKLPADLPSLLSFPKSFAILWRPSVGVFLVVVMSSLQSPNKRKQLKIWASCIRRAHTVTFCHWIFRQMSESVTFLN